MSKAAWSTPVGDLGKCSNSDFAAQVALLTFQKLKLRVGISQFTRRMRIPRFRTWRGSTRKKKIAPPLSHLLPRRVIGLSERYDGTLSSHLVVKVGYKTYNKPGPSMELSQHTRGCSDCGRFAAFHGPWWQRTPSGLRPRQRRGASCLPLPALQTELKPSRFPC